MCETVGNIYCNNIQKSYKEKVVLSIQQLTLSEHAIIGVVGSNGAGKSTFLHILAGLDSAYSGTIKYFNNIDLSKQSTLVLQKTYLLRGTVRKNLEYPLKVRRIPKLERDKRVEEILQLFDLKEQEYQNVATLSGGEAQRTSIARALIFNPTLLFLDEPTANIDPISTKMIENVLKEQSKKGVTIVIVTHNLMQANRLCDEIVFLKQGKYIETVTGKNPLLNAKTTEFKEYISNEVFME